MKKTITYLIKKKDDALYITNKPSEANDAIKYSTDKRDAREFNGLDNSIIDMTKHIAIKKTVTETIEYEEVDYE
jgi:6-phosphogluconolactonase (cycloisomerase 2 family)